MDAQPSPPVVRRPARWWQKLLLLLGVLVLVPLLLEFVLAELDLAAPLPRGHVKGPDEEQNRNVCSDPVFGWRLCPAREFTMETEGRRIPYRSNAQGFRIDDRAEAARAGARTIAFVGDSFTFGTGVAYADTFAARAAAELGAGALNRGMLGYGLDQMWLVLRKIVLPERPDLVVVSVIDDDLERSLHADSVRLGGAFTKPVFMVEDGNLVPRDPDEPGIVSSFLDRHSRLLAAWNGVGRRVGRQWAVGEWWDLNARLLDAIIDDTRQAGVPLLVAYIRTDNLWQPLPALERHLAARGVPFVDVGREWSCSREEGFLPRDHHFSPAGHAAAARTIARVVAARWPGLFARN